MKQLLFTLIISTFFSTYIIAQKDLTGLKSIIVKVELDENLEKEGYNSETIKTDTELELRLAHINVIDREQYTSDNVNKTATLYVNIMSFVKEIGYTYHIALSTLEPVTVPRLDKDDYIAITWGRSALGITTGGYRGWQFIREAAKELVNEFLNDYLKDNPKN